MKTIFNKYIIVIMVQAGNSVITFDPLERFAVVPLLWNSILCPSIIINITIFLALNFFLIHFFVNLISNKYRLKQLLHLFLFKFLNYVSPFTIKYVFKLLKKKLTTSITWKAMPKVFTFAISFFYLAPPHTPEYYANKAWINEFAVREPDFPTRFLLRRIGNKFFNRPESFADFWYTLIKPAWEKCTKEECINYLHLLINSEYPKYKDLKDKEEKNWKSLYEDHRQFDDFINFLLKKFERFSDPEYWIKQSEGILNSYDVSYYPLYPLNDIEWAKYTQDTYLFFVNKVKESPYELKCLFEEWDFIPKIPNLSIFWQIFNNNYWLISWIAVCLAIFVWICVIGLSLKIDRYSKIDLVCENIIVNLLILTVVENVIPFYQQYTFPFIIYLPFIWLTVSLILFIFERLKLIQLIPILLKFDTILKQIIYWIWMIFVWICKCIWTIIKKFVYYLD